MGWPSTTVKMSIVKNETIENREAAFAEEYIKSNYDSRLAYEAISGDSARTRALAKGKEYTKKPMVQRYVGAAQRLAEENLRVTVHTLVNDLVDIKERCMSQNTAASLMIALKAIEMLGKHLRMFDEPKEVKDRTGLEEVPTEKLLKLADAIVVPEEANDQASQ